MQEIRCNCGRLLAKAKFEQLEIKCPRCKTLIILKAIEPHTQAPKSANFEAKHDQTNHSVDGRQISSG